MVCTFQRDLVGIWLHKATNNVVLILKWGINDFEHRTSKQPLVASNISTYLGFEWYWPIFRTFLVIFFFFFFFLVLVVFLGQFWWLLGLEWWKSFWNYEDFNVWAKFERNKIFLSSLLFILNTIHNVEFNSLISKFLFLQK